MKVVPSAVMAGLKHTFHGPDSMTHDLYITRALMGSCRRQQSGSLVPSPVIDGCRLASLVVQECQIEDSHPEARLFVERLAECWELVMAPALAAAK